jgi:pimeloyl-ACP methyl ester carboxylesterase/predicted amino acid-binding ACT domain protein
MAQVITTLPPKARARWHVDHLVSDVVEVAGRRAAYAAGGRGLPVLFLHGWGLDHRAYQRSLRRLTARGCRVVAPSMPGFGRTNALPRNERTLAAYGRWVAEFLDAVGIDEPVVVLGHSLGGGVATRFAHDHPERVRYLVLLNSVGDPTAFVGSALNPVGGLHPRGVMAPVISALTPTADGASARLIPRVFLENVVKDPVAVADAAWLGLSADLRQEMAALAARELPVLVLWSDNDGVIPMTAFDTFCAAFGADGHVVSGGHSWLLADPDTFGQVLDNVLHVQSAQHHVQAATASTSELRLLLRDTSVPRRVVSRLLRGVSPLWVLSAPPAVLAADLALCHPRLGADEIRAVARPITSGNRFRLTVVGHDRAGFLADTSAVLAREDVWVEGASVATWPDRRLALHALTVRSTGELDADRWGRIGKQLREVAAGDQRRMRYVPSGQASVTLTGEGDGRSVVRVTAPDRLGLLSAITRWFADHDLSVDAANISTVDGIAKDVFLIEGTCDVDQLARHLSERPAFPLLSAAVRATTGTVGAAVDVALAVPRLLCPSIGVLRAVPTTRSRERATADPLAARPTG